MKPETRAGLFQQMAAVLATGNQGVVEDMPLPAGLPSSVTAAFRPAAAAPFAAALVEGNEETVAAVTQAVAAMPGPIISVHAPDLQRDCAYQSDWLLEEVSTSINTTAAGGNASLMMMA